MFDWFESDDVQKSLSWILRIKVAIDAAKGLAFLHSDPVKVIYRDIKASNILLNSVYALSKIFKVSLLSYSWDLKDTDLVLFYDNRTSMGNFQTLG